MNELKVIISPGVLPTTSTKMKINKVFLCDSQKCKRVMFGSQRIKVRGMHVCYKCGSGVTDITFSELGRRFAGV